MFIFNWATGSHLPVHSKHVFEKVMAGSNKYTIQMSSESFMVS